MRQSLSPDAKSDWRLLTSRTIAATAEGITYVTAFPFSCKGFDKFIRYGRLFSPKLSDFFTHPKGGGEAKKPFRAITFNGLNQPGGMFNHHLMDESSRSVAQTFNVSHSKRV